MTEYQFDDRAHPDIPPEVVIAVYREVRPAFLVDDVPQFGSLAWTELPAGHPAREAATTRAALAWWSAEVFGNNITADAVNTIVAARLATVSKDIQGADPELWRRVARDRAARVPQQRDRSHYGAHVEGAQ